MARIINVVDQHAKYAVAAVEVKEIIDEAFNAVVGVFKAHGSYCKMTDEAEELVAAIHHYYERSLH